MGLTHMTKVVYRVAADGIKVEDALHTFVSVKFSRSFV
jgi:hypothetical protein